MQGSIIFDRQKTHVKCTFFVIQETINRRNFIHSIIITLYTQWTFPKI